MRRLDVEEAVRALHDAQVVVVPTDTVYGVAARLADADAVARLFAVKRRPQHVALPVLVGSLAQIADLGVDWSDDAQRLADRFWPGALTIVVAAPPAVAARVGARSTLGVRHARQPQLSSIIAQCGPLAVTSANEHGQRPCVSVEDVEGTTWGAPVAGVLDAGVCDGEVSTVVELTSDGWQLRREGGVRREDVEAVLGPEAAADDH